MSSDAPCASFRPGGITVRTTCRDDTDDVLVDCDPIDGTPDTLAAECYGTMNNRLMAYEVRRGSDEALMERVLYQYEARGAAAGNPTFIVRRVYNPNAQTQPPVNYAWSLTYNNSGTLWFINHSRWTGANCLFVEDEKISIHEFRSDGRAMRLTRVTCSPRLDPVLMRVLTARMGKEILNEAEATWPGPDHRQAA